MISILLILQLIAHFLSDFIFQSDKFAIQKNKKGVDSKYLYIHILITFIFSYALSFQWQFFMAALVISLLHFVIDVLKSVLIQKQVFPKLLFFIDQFLHLMIIVAVVYKYQQYYQIDYIYFSQKYLLILLGFIVTAKPANIFIKEIFKAFDISVGKTADLPNAGKLIGVIERWLILIFIIIGQFEAVGFLLASKSILRYGDKENDNPNKTEYVLIGTLLSFAIAVVVGLAIQKLK